MNDVDPRLTAALRRQLDARPEGAPRVGWKVGSGDGERIGDEIAVGHLRAMPAGETYHEGAGHLHADAEVAVEVGGDGTIAGYAAALELVDLSRAGTPEEVVATNVYHCAVAFGPFRRSLPAHPHGTLVVNGELRASGQAPADLAERVVAVARVLGAVGEELRPGDRIITGLIVQVPVAPGDGVVADLGALGRVEVSIS